MVRQIKDHLKPQI